MNQTSKHNCYLYDDECLVRGSVIFGPWFRHISELKEKFPKNGLVKFMGSSFHGHITQDNYVIKSIDEVVEQSLDIGKLSTNRYIIKDTYFFGELEKFKLIDTHKKNRFNIRLKSFLTAYMRNKTSRVVSGHVYFGKDEKKNDVHDLNDVIRVCVDSVCFKKKMPDLENVPDLKPESKSSEQINKVDQCSQIPQ